MNQEKPKILFLSSDEKSFALFKDEFLPRLNKEIPLQSACLCSSFPDALAQLGREFTVYISDLELQGGHNETGLDFYQSVRINSESAPFILLNADKKAAPEDDKYFHYCPSSNLEEIYQLVRSILVNLNR